MGTMNNQRRNLPFPQTPLNMLLVTINTILRLPNGTAISNQQVFIIMPKNAL